jgi:hypothetical protein
MIHSACLHHCDVAQMDCGGIGIVYKLKDSRPFGFVGLKSIPREVFRENAGFLAPSTMATGELDRRSMGPARGGGA